MFSRVSALVTIRQTLKTFAHHEKETSAKWRKVRFESSVQLRDFYVYDSRGKLALVQLYEINYQHWLLATTSKYFAMIILPGFHFNGNICDNLLVYFRNS